jgi:hypothetical protein
MKLSQELFVSNKDRLALTLKLIPTHTPQNGKIQIGSPEYNVISLLFYASKFHALLGYRRKNFPS